jgi:hypothetical protein
MRGDANPLRQEEQMRFASSRRRRWPSPSPCSVASRLSRPAATSPSYGRPGLPESVVARSHPGGWLRPFGLEARYGNPRVQPSLRLPASAWAANAWRGSCAKSTQPQAHGVASARPPTPPPGFVGLGGRYRVLNGGTSGENLRAFPAILHSRRARLATPHHAGLEYGWSTAGIRVLGGVDWRVGLLKPDVLSARDKPTGPTAAPEVEHRNSKPLLVPP